MQYNDGLMFIFNQNMFFCKCNCIYLIKVIKPKPEIMDLQYFVGTNGTKSGPFTIEELKTQDITKDTLVWKEGMDKWTKAGDVKNFNDFFKSIPPPLPKSESNTTTKQAPPLPKTDTKKYFGYTLAKRRERFFAMAIESLIFFIPYFVLLAESGKRRTLESAKYFSAEFYLETFVGAILSAALGAVFYSLWSGNLGHKIFGLKVISSVNGKDKKDARSGAFREFLKSTLGLLFFPAIWLLWDDDRQNLYDKITKTYVVKNS